MRTITFGTQAHYTDPWVVLHSLNYVYIAFIYCIASKVMRVAIWDRLEGR